MTEDKIFFSGPSAIIALQYFSSLELLFIIRDCTEVILILTGIINGYGISSCSVGMQVMAVVHGEERAPEELFAFLE
jgi:hypothetical protein